MYSWWICRADTVCGSTYIELNRRPVRNATGCGNRSAAHLAFELVDFQPSIRERHNAIAILQPKRQISSGKSRIHDLDLPLYVGVRAVAATSDVELELTRTCDVGIDQMTQTEINRSQGSYRHWGIARYGYRSLQLQIGGCSANCRSLQGQYTVAVI